MGPRPNDTITIPLERGSRPALLAQKGIMDLIYGSVLFYIYIKIKKNIEDTSKELIRFNANASMSFS